MVISRDEVAHIARLARLDLTPAELLGLTRDLAGILEYVRRLDALETAGTPGGEDAPVSAGATPFRDDVVLPSLPVEEAVRPAADHDGEFFRVPPVIEREDQP